MPNSGTLNSVANGEQLRRIGVNVIGNIYVSDTLTFEKPVQLAGCALVRCRIGAYSYVSQNSRLHHTSIGRYCSIADNVTCSPGDHPTSYLSTSPSIYLDPFSWYNGVDYEKDWNPHGPVKIGNDVWICANVTVMSNVEVGHGAILAAGCVVNKNVDPYMVVGGVPGKALKPRFSENIIERLLNIEAWQYDLPLLCRKANILLNRNLDDRTLEELEIAMAENPECRLSGQTHTLTKHDGDSWKLSQS